MSQPGEFDPDGWLPPGESLAPSDSGRLEGVFTAQQWQRMIDEQK